MRVCACLPGGEVRGGQGPSARARAALGGPGRHESTVRHPGAAHLVGVLLGHHGAGDVLRDVRHVHGHVRLLRTH